MGDSQVVLEEPETTVYTATVLQSVLVYRISLAFPRAQMHPNDSKEGPALLRGKHPLLQKNKTFTQIYVYHVPLFTIRKPFPEQQHPTESYGDRGYRNTSSIITVTVHSQLSQ